MKKMMSLLLALAMILSAAGSVTVGAAEAATSFKDESRFYFSFENESDFDHPDMLLDSAATSKFQTPGLTKYCPGANGSKGAVALHVESATGGGNVNEGVSNIKMLPGKDYELTMDLKLFSPEIFAQLPNITLFFMTQGVQMYEDADCTRPGAVSSSNYQSFTIPGSKAFRFEADGKTVSGDWGNFNQTITLSNVFNGKYVKQNEPVNVKLFIRLGANPHALNNTSDFTQEFLDACEVLDNDQKNLWMDYAIDNIGMRRSTIVPEAPVEKDSALWRASFENTGWASETAGVAFSTEFAKSVLVNDVPAGSSGRSEKSIELSYTGNTSNGGFTQLTATTTSNDKKIWYNRAYEVSFWAKGSQAAAEFYQSSGRKTQIIPERADSSRLDRTFPKWTSYLVSEPITTEWQKYTYLLYEEMPMALGRDGDNNWKMQFHIRYQCVPGKTSNDLSETVDGETIQYAWKNGDNYYKLDDFKFYIDDFTVTPLDIVLNGDMSKTAGTQADYTTIWYTGADNKIRISATGDPLSPAVFHNGTMEADATFSTETGLPNENVLKVTKDGGAPYQNVDIENGKKYKISFWAKADDQESVGKPVSAVLDRDLQGEILDASAYTLPDFDVILNKDGYDGYGALTGKTGSVPFYMYAGTLDNKHHKPGVLLPTNNKETLVYDEYYDRMFSKNTQAGKDATAWAYQYYNGTEWAGTNDKAAIAPATALSENWMEYTMEYTWSYPGKHYRMPKLAFEADANYRLANVKIEEITVEEDTKPEFCAENVTASGGDKLSAGDNITVTYDFVVKSGAAQEGNTIVQAFADGGSGYYLLSTAVADEPGKAVFEATANMVGKALKFKVIPFDKEGNAGVSAEGEFIGRVVYAMTHLFEFSSDYKKANWTFDAISSEAGANSNLEIIIASYSAERQLVSAQKTDVQILEGDNHFTGAYDMPVQAVKVKMFVWEQDTQAPVMKPEELTPPACNTDPFAGDSEINVVFLGGSITEGGGNKGYANLTGEWLKQTYGADKTVNYYNEGVGGTPSDYGLLRFNRDVVSHNPDVVFIEFAVNDGGRDTRVYMESMVRTLQSLPNNPYIIFLYTTNESYSTPTAYHEEVAEFYGIPQISLKNALKRELNGANAKEAGYLKDSVHPNDKGYAVYFNEIKNCLASGRYYQRPIIRADKLIANSGAVETEFIPASGEKVKRSSGWTAGGSGKRPWVKSTTLGDTLKFSFDGTILAFEHGLNSASAMYEVKVDGEKVLTGNPYYGTTSNQLVCDSSTSLFHLPDGHHEVEVTTVQNSNASSMGNQVMIYNIITGRQISE